MPPLDVLEGPEAAVGLIGEQLMEALVGQTRVAAAAAGAVAVPATRLLVASACPVAPWAGGELSPRRPG
jgi:hypothetical protein